MSPDPVRPDPAKPEAAGPVRPTRIVALADLDDTLFQTRGKCRLDGQPLEAALLTPAALDRAGEPLSFMTPAQRILVDHLLAEAWLVPVTARSREALSRVTLRFSHGAIVDFGGLILSPDGSIDQAWRDEIAPQAIASKDLLESVLELALSVVRRGSLKARPRLISDDSLPFYVVAKTDPGLLGELAWLAEEISSAHGERTRIHLNGNNLAILPSWLDKASAARHYLRTFVPWPRGDYLLLGLGDSDPDLGFLGLCDYRLIPAGGRLAGTNP